MVKSYLMKVKAKKEKGCKEIQSLIPGYLSGNLNLRQAKDFTRHLKKCKDCREEIEISYLLDKGIERVENGETVDLHADMEYMLSNTENAILQLKQFRTAVYLIESTAVFVLIACVLMLYLF